MTRALAAILAPVLSGVLLLFSFPRYDLEFLAWFALVPLLLATLNAPRGTAFRRGWFAGMIFFTGTLSWVVNAMHEYGHMPIAVSYFVLLLLAGYCALFMGVFTALLPLLRGQSRWLPLWGAPALWVTLELLRTHLFTGFPWALLGYSQYRALPLIQIADITGVYGVSFVVVLVNCVMGTLLQGLMSRTIVLEKPAPFPWIKVPVAGVFLAGIVAYGQWWLMPFSDPRTDQSVRIGLVQGNIDQARKWDVAFRRETIDRYKRLTAEAAQGSDLVIWPEASTPFLFEVETDYREELLKFVREKGIPLLFGSPAAVLDKAGGQVRLLNSAFLVSGDGVVLDRYDKIHLVPFGEYVPLKTILAFLDKLVVGIGDFIPGTAPHVMSGPGGQFGVVICFEVIFPDLVRRFVDQGADYMITITNDAWFGRSSAPYQHFTMVVFRAIENRVAFARAANTGISGFIDAQGHIPLMSDIFVEEALSGRIRTGGPRTFYTAYGDVFAYGCGILALFRLMVSRRKKR